MKRKFLGRVLPVMLLGGCAELQDHHADFVNDCRAHRAWHRCTTLADHFQISDDYRKGWLEGYSDVLMGGCGNPPSVPPACYWSAQNQDPGGLQRIEHWYNGFRRGAVAAQSTGYWTQVPIHLTGGPCGPQCPTCPPSAVTPCPSPGPTLPNPELQPGPVRPVVPPAPRDNGALGPPSVGGGVPAAPPTEGGASGPSGRPEANDDAEPEAYGEPAPAPAAPPAPSDTGPGSDASDFDPLDQIESWRAPELENEVAVYRASSPRGRSEPVSGSGTASVRTGEPLVPLNYWRLGGPDE